ncbi:MAG: zinc ribbon domain-containing protein [Chloracidobacterium sp.]|nr:zinc ribbon domain-containing protein [Chloracidobacterium sp.]
MHCPKCGQQQISDEIRFCSKCGFSMMGVSALLAGDGEFPGAPLAGKKRDSPKKRGIKQGVFIFLLTFLLVPLAALFHVATNTEPFLAAIATISLTFGGLLRIVYALMFESGEPQGAGDTDLFSMPQRYFNRARGKAELPAGEPVPASVYSQPQTGKWRDTNELGVPMSVTDSTTKLLANEKDADQ